MVVVDGELGGDPVHGAGQLGQGVSGLLPVQQHVYTISSQHHNTMTRHDCDTSEAPDHEGLGVCLHYALQCQGVAGSAAQHGQARQDARGN